MPQEGKTPLHWAAKNGHAAIVKALLAAEADKEAKDQVSGGRGEGASGLTDGKPCALVRGHNLVSLVQSEIEFCEVRSLELRPGIFI